MGLSQEYDVTGIVARTCKIENTFGNDADQQSSIYWPPYLEFYQPFLPFFPHSLPQI